jgi:hypothetical protein
MKEKKEERWRIIGCKMGKQGKSSGKRTHEE